MTDLQDVRFQRNLAPHDRHLNDTRFNSSTTKKIVRRTSQLGEDMKHQTQRLHNPTMKKTLRQHHNSSIADQERRTKALVLSCREVEMSANSSYKRLQTSLKRLETFMTDVVKRNAWVNGKTMEMRCKLPCDFEPATKAQLNEKKLCKLCQKEIQSCMDETLECLRYFKKARAALSAYIHRQSQCLDLNSESYSGSVLRYERPVTEPKVVAEVKSAISTADIRASTNQKCMQATLDKIKLQSQKMEHAIKSSMENAKRMQSEISVGIGNATTSLNLSSRQINNTTIRREMNEGPRESRFATVAERSSRPQVRAHSRATASMSKTFQTFEEDSYGAKHFDRQIKSMKTTAQAIDKRKQQLQKSHRDWCHMYEIEDRTLKFRRRCQAGHKIRPHEQACLK